MPRGLALTVDADRIVPIVAERITPAALVEIVELLAGTSSPAGRERPLAEAVVSWGRTNFSQLNWQLDVLSETSASVLSYSVLGADGLPDLAVYSHLDTSLSGDSDSDERVTGVTAPAPSLQIDLAAGVMRGLGLGVAKGPAASGLLAYVVTAVTLHELGIAHRLGLLIAAGGTHRAAPPGAPTAVDPTLALGFGTGVGHALHGGFRPGGVLVAKSGPPGVIYEEPGALYLRVRIQGPWGSVMEREQLSPPGGLTLMVGALVDAVEGWRHTRLAEYAGRASPGASLAPEVGIGALEAGLPYKADLLPGAVDAFVYVVTVDDTPSGIVADDLERWLLRELGPKLSDRCSLSVRCFAFVPVGRTPKEAPLVTDALGAWEHQFGSDPAVESWSGSTDGVLFRSAGIDTVRLGPQPTYDSDHRVDIMSIAQLVDYASVYADIILRYLSRAAPDRDGPVRLGRGRP